MLTFPISVVRLSSYHKTVLIDGYTKFLNIKSYYFDPNYSSRFLTQTGIKIALGFGLLSLRGTTLIDLDSKQLYHCLYLCKKYLNLYLKYIIWQ